MNFDFMHLTAKSLNHPSVKATQSPGELQRQDDFWEAWVRELASSLAGNPLAPDTEVYQTVEQKQTGPIARELNEGPSVDVDLEDQSAGL